MDWIAYSEREEWKDVTPVPQDDGPVPVVSIAYSNRFKDVMGYFRHVLLTDEVSARAWDVTDDAIECNPANYTAWAFRRKLVTGLNRDLQAEMEHTHQMAIENPKNYQIWHHRKCLCELVKDGSGEQAFTAEAFEQDAKNYHAWSHRQWAVRHFNMWEGEHAYLDSLIALDVRNNSAWNHRYFVLSNLDDRPTRIAQEITFAKQVLTDGPFNDSAWGYLRGCCEETAGELAEFCDGVLAKYPECVQAMDTLVQLALTQNTAEMLTKASEMCNQLQEVDSIRSKYWAYQLELVITQLDGHGAAVESL